MSCPATVVESSSKSSNDYQAFPTQSLLRPTPTLDALPLEILLQIANYLPDVHSAIRLSLTSKWVYQNLAGSRFFWYRWGNRQLKSFQQYKSSFDYRKYVMNVVTGKFKSTCQICFTPKVAKARPETEGRNLCDICLLDNVISADGVWSIPNVDLSDLGWIRYKSKNSKDPNYQYYAFDYRGVQYFVWLPTVKARAEAVYKIPWKEIVKNHLSDVRWLATPSESRAYRIKKMEQIMKVITTETYKDFYWKYFHEMFDEEEFRDLVKDNLTNHGRIEIEVMHLRAPIEGQIEDENACPKKFARHILSDFCGVGRDGVSYLNHYGRDYNLTDAIRNKQRDRLAQSGRTNGECQLCKDQGCSIFTIDLNSFYDHVRVFHPENCLKLDWGWAD